MNDSQTEGSGLKEINEKFSTGENWDQWMKQITDYVKQLNSQRSQTSNPTSDAATLGDFASQKTDNPFKSDEAKNALQQVFSLEDGNITLRKGDQSQQKTFEDNLNSILDSTDEPVTVELLTESMIEALPEDKPNAIQRIINKLKEDPIDETPKPKEKENPREKLRRLIETFRNQEIAPANGANTGGTE